MTESERLEGLRAALDESAGAYLDEISFIAWQGRCFGLLGYSIIHQARFRDHAEKILEDYDFYSNVLSPEVRKCQLKLEGILSQAIGEVASKDNPARLTPRDKAVSKTVPPKEESSKTLHSILGKEQGLLWYWHHCHFTIKWKIIFSFLGVVGAVFALGVTAGRNNFLQQLWDLFQTVGEKP